jgi:NAD(P)H-nitrite reductase large subunit
MQEAKPVKGDLPEKGAIVQRDRETYAIAPHIPGGIIDPATLRKIADVAEKYNAKVLKITSAQRIAIVGIDPKDIDNAWKDLGMKPGAAIGLCVRSVKICPGTTFCKRAKQDSVGVGLKLDEIYHGMNMPSKFKIGVSGCANSCAESAVKDIGLNGTSHGWKVTVGGCSGAKARVGEVLAEGLNDDQVFDLVKRIVDYYKASGTKLRLGSFIDQTGFENFKREVLNP